MMLVRRSLLHASSTVRSRSGQLSISPSFNHPRVSRSFLLHHRYASSTSFSTQLNEWIFGKKQSSDNQPRDSVPTQHSTQQQQSDANTTEFGQTLEPTSSGVESDSSRSSYFQSYWSWAKSKVFGTDISNSNQSVDSVASTSSSDVEKQPEFLSDEELSQVVQGLGGSDAVLSHVDTVIESTWHWYTPLQNLMYFYHDSAGLPWWLAIGAATVTIRALFLPFTYYALAGSLKLKAVMPVINRLREVASEASKTGKLGVAKEARSTVQAVMKEENVNPLKSMIGPVSQIPVFIGFFLAVRNLAEVEPTMKTGGAYWFLDLSAADPYLVLPGIACVVMLATIEFGGDGGNSALQSKNVKMGIRAMALVSTFITYRFPSALFLYWIPTNVVSLTTTKLMHSNFVAARIGAKEIKNPDLYLKRREAPQAMKIQLGTPPKSMTPTEAANTYRRKKPDQIDAVPDVEVSGSTLKLFSSRPKRKKSPSL